MRTALFQSPRQFQVVAGLGPALAGWLDNEDDLARERARFREFQRRERYYRLLERERERYGSRYSRYGGDGTFSGLGGLGGLGDAFTDIVEFVKFSSKDFVETLTGEKSARETQTRALQLAKIQADQAAAKAAGTAETVQKVIPWVVGGAVVITAAVLLLKK